MVDNWTVYKHIHDIYTEIYIYTETYTLHRHTRTLTNTHAHKHIRQLTVGRVNFNSHYIYINDYIYTYLVLKPYIAKDNFSGNCYNK